MAAEDKQGEGDHRRPAEEGAVGVVASRDGGAGDAGGASPLGGLFWGLAAATFLVSGLLLATESISGSQAKSVMIWLALSGVCLSLVWHRLERSAAISALFVLTVISIANYTRWGPDLVTSIDRHDPIHYYMGAKYFEELGSFDLYPALAAADSRHRRWATIRGRTYYDMTVKGFRRRPYKHALTRGRELRRTRFTEQRWAEFEHDMLAFQDFMGRRHFRGVLGDKGFNATPGWIAYAGPIVQAVPVEWLKALCMLDVFLVAFAISAIGWAYGRVAVMFSLFYLSVTISMRWLTPGVVFMRYDWLCAMVLAMCLLKRGRHRAAGVAAGLAAVLRYFPAVWVWGPASKAAIQLLTPGRPWRERFNWRLLGFGIAFVGCFAALQGAATLSLGTQAVTDHWAKINHHISPEMISSKRPGLAVAATYDGRQSPKALSKARRLQMRQQKPARTFLAVALMLMLAWGLRKRPDDEAFAFGYVPFFLLTTATYYYQVCRLTLLVVHASDLSKLRNRVGLALLFGMEVWSNWVTTRLPSREVLWCGWLSWSLAGYSLLMIGWLWFEARGERPQRVESERDARDARELAGSGIPAKTRS